HDLERAGAVEEDDFAQGHGLDVLQEGAEAEMGAAGGRRRRAGGGRWRRRGRRGDGVTAGRAVAGIGGPRGAAPWARHGGAHHILTGRVSDAPPDAREGPALRGAGLPTRGRSSIIADHGTVSGAAPGREPPDPSLAQPLLVPGYLQRLPAEAGL